MKFLSFVACVAFFASTAFSAEDSRYFQNVMVGAGDTLWSLSQKYLKDPQRWPELLKYNQLPTSDPTVALPGMVLRIPVLEIKESLRAAKLMEWVNRAAYRKTNSALWLDAAKDLELFQDYGIRTGETSWMRVRFAVGEDLTLGANSFAIVRPQGLPDNMGRGANLLSGEVRSRGVKLLTQSAKIIPKSAETDYRARIRDDLATVVEVYKGATDVQAKGKSVEVKAGFATEVRPGKPPELPTQLPPVPEMVLAPLKGLTGQDSAVEMPGKMMMRGGVFSISLPKKEDFEDRSGPRVSSRKALELDSYRIQIAHKPDFQQVIWDGQRDVQSSFNIKEVRLEDGVYYFRVSYRDRLGFESPFSKAEKVALDTKAPVLTIENPSETPWTARKNPIRISGISEPGAVIKIGIKSITVDASGKFAEDFVMNKGVNPLRITATDASGNSTQTNLSLRYEATGNEIAKAEKEEKDAEAVGKETGPAGERRAARTAAGIAATTAILTVLLLLLVG